MTAAVVGARPATGVVDAASLHRISDALGESSGHCSWLAVLSAGGIAALPAAGHAGWMIESFELRWRGTPGADDLPVRVRVAIDPRLSGERVVVRTTAERGGVAMAEAITRARLRDQPARAAVALSTPEAAYHWTRVVTAEQVQDYCAALGVDPWSTQGLDWAGIRPRPQPVVPLGLLAADAARLLAAEGGWLAAEVRTPVLAGAVLRWSRAGSLVWIAAPDGTPAIVFRLHG